MTNKNNNLVREMIDNLYEEDDVIRDMRTIFDYEANRLNVLDIKSKVKMYRQIIERATK